MICSTVKHAPNFCTLHSPLCTYEEPPRKEIGFHIKEDGVPYRIDRPSRRSRAEHPSVMLNEGTDVVMVTNSDENQIALKNNK